MSTKTAKKRHVKEVPAKFKSSTPVVMGPAIIFERISDRQVLEMLRDSINIALAATAPPRQNTPTASYIPSNWHNKPMVQAKPKAAKSSRFYQPAPATSSPEQKTWRARVVEWVQNFVGPKPEGMSDADYQAQFSKAYRDAYRQLMLRHKVDVLQRARNFARKFIFKGQSIPAGNEPIDFVERLGYMEELFRIVCEMYPANHFNAVDPAMRSEPVLAPMTAGSSI